MNGALDMHGKKWEAEENTERRRPLETRTWLVILKCALNRVECGRIRLACKLFYFFCRPYASDGIATLIFPWRAEKWMEGWRIEWFKEVNNEELDTSRQNQKSLLWTRLTRSCSVRRTTKASPCVHTSPISQERFTLYLAQQGMETRKRLIRAGL